MIVREEAPRDHDAIEALILTAFDGHPQHAPGARPTEHLIVRALRASERLTLSLVADDQGMIVGHLCLSPVLIDGEATAWFGLGPVAVAPACHRKGIGARLIREGLGRMQEQGAAGVVVLGEPEYYGRFGFSRHPGLWLAQVPEDAFLALPLGDRGSSMPTGEVTYDTAFLS